MVVCGGVVRGRGTWLEAAVGGRAWRGGGRRTKEMDSREEDEKRSEKRVNDLNLFGLIFKALCSIIQG